MDVDRTGVKLHGNDLFQTSMAEAHIDFENEGGETYICGNPPYLGSTWQDDEQKVDLQAIFVHRTKSWKSLDYVAGWFMKAADYGTRANAAAALVCTNSLCQSRQVPILWPLIFATAHEIAFAHTSLKWANLASNKAGLTVVIFGISNHAGKLRPIYSRSVGEDSIVKKAEQINAYFVPGPNVYVSKAPSPLNSLARMSFGNKPVDGGYL